MTTAANNLWTVAIVTVEGPQADSKVGFGVLTRQGVGVGGGARECIYCNVSLVQ